VDDRIPAMLASSFARTTGIDRDDLMQEALIAYWWADACGNYDPHYAAFSTYATHCVTRRLCDVVRATNRQPRYDEMPADDTLADPAPSALDRIEFADVLRGLPEDARTVVRMVLDDAQALAGMTRTAARRALRERLGECLPPRQVDRAFAAIRRALRNGGAPARARWA
jgi:RNA polymerase sigma factor (sigma-70 family)